MTSYNFPSFKKEYNKMQTAAKQFHDEYMDMLKATDLKTMFTLLMEQGFLPERIIDKFTKLFDMFVLDPTNSTAAIPITHHIPHLADSNRLTIKKKQLARYVHPDKILQMYGSTICNEHGPQFLDFSKYLHNSTNTCFDTMVYMFIQNEHVFTIIVDKLVSLGLISNNEIKSIKQTGKNRTYFETHDYKLPAVYSMFPVEVNLFVTQYNMLAESESHERWINDVFSLIYTSINYINTFVNNGMWVPNMTIIQIFEKNNLHQPLTVLNILQTHLPHCHQQIVKMYEMHKTVHYIRTPCAIRLDDFKTNLLLDIYQNITVPI